MPCHSEIPDANRFFNCAACSCLVVICSRCDRGHRYCSHCAPKVRPERLREASRRYQSTRKGKLNHALRQRRYRERQKLKKVTQHSSREVYKRALLRKAQKSVFSSYSNTVNPRNFLTRDHNCAFCRNSSTRFLRLYHLRDRLYPGNGRRLRMNSTSPP